MEIVERENVKITSSVIVSGLTNTELDEDLSDFLNSHGRVARVLRIDDPQSPHHKDAIVEYESCYALTTLEPLMPHDFKSSHNIT